jgi:hypothetical protein
LKPDSFNGFAGTLRASPGTSRHKEVTSMPTAKELSIELDDRPGTLGKICRSLADRGVNILGFDSKPSDTKGKSEVRLVVDNTTTAKSVLDNQKLRYTETEVAQVKLPNRPGELARAASKLGDANININHGYCAIDPQTNEPVLIFATADAGRAAKVLDEAAAAAAKA